MFDIIVATSIARVNATIKASNIVIRHHPLWEVQPNNYRPRVTYLL